MTRSGYVLAALVFLGIHVVFTVRMQTSDRLLRVSDRKVVGLDEVLDSLEGAGLVFVGELHDQPAHHEAQLRLVQALHGAGRPVAVALEMIGADSQGDLDRWVAGETSLAEFLPIYYANWNFPWVYYRDVFLYAREHSIPMVALNVPQQVIRQVARSGFSSLSADQERSLPAVQCVVDDQYEQFIRRAMGMHGNSGAAFRNFCEAQLLWDTAMAVNLLDFVEARPDHTVVVIAGSGHAWKRGIPLQVSLRADLPMRVIVPHLPAGAGWAAVQPGDADYLWLGLELR